MEFFDITGKINTGEKSKTDLPSEDLRFMQNGKVFVSDRRGSNILYGSFLLTTDLSLQDLEIFETSMLKIITAYINSNANLEAILDLEYLDELRFRTANKRCIS
jgi:dTDP-D-glucose 4,6-dehydratase